jgi:hypothetical protein
MQNTRHLKLVTALGRRLDAAVCAGSIANAARSVRADEARADQRRDAHAAVAELEAMMMASRRSPHRRTG